MMELKVKLQKGCIKQMMAVVIAFCLGLTMLPMTAFAEGEEAAEQIFKLEEVSITAVSPAAQLPYELQEGGEGVEVEAVLNNITAISPEDATQKDITGKTAEDVKNSLNYAWESDAPEVAEVKANDEDASKAMITPKSEGFAEIMLTVSKGAGELKASIQVNVSADPNKPGSNDTYTVEKVEILDAPAEMNKGDRTVLTAEVEMTPLSPSAPVDITWETSDPESITLAAPTTGESVEVIALKENSSATITATASYGDSSKTDSVTIFVSGTPKPGIDETKIEKVVIKDAPETMDKDQEAVLTAEVEMTPLSPSAPADITWETSDPESITLIAPTTGNSVAVKALKEGGSATITATAVYGDSSKSAEVTIAVNESEKTIPVTSIALDKKELLFHEIGAQQTLTAFIGPEDATDKSVTWSSDNEKTATVKDGKVTAVGNGTAVITAKAGDKTATAAVTVSQKTEKISLVLNGQTVKGTLQAQIKKSYALKAVIEPKDADAKNAEVKWSTSNNKIATVVNGKVKIKKAGTVTITAKTADGNEAKVKFKAAKAPVKVKKLKIQGTKNMKVKEKQVLKVVVTPATAANQKVSWKSSNSKVASVNSKGKVTAKKKGSVKITATAKDGSKKKVVFRIKVK